MMKVTVAEAPFNVGLEPEVVVISRSSEVGVRPVFGRRFQGHDIPVAVISGPEAPAFLGSV
jgi:hypothetical protein